MGDPKKQRKKYKTPPHPWNKERIEAERALIKEYGLKNKKELWKAEFLLKKIKAQAKSLISKTGKQAEREKSLLIKKLAKLGLISCEGSIESILDLNLKQILERRLQTIVYKTGMARQIKQARQYITHRHILVNNKKITAPSYLVQSTDSVTFDTKSPLANPEHPERRIIEKKVIGEVKRSTEPKPMEEEE